jgi:hypothetical protein
VRLRKRRTLLPLVGLGAIALVTALAVVGLSFYADGDDGGTGVVLPEDADPGSAAPPS